MKGKPITIVWIGRFTGPKGELAEKIIKEVLPEFPDIVFTFVGGPRNKVLEEMAPSNARFTGFIDNVTDTIRTHDLVIGAGRVALEAIQAEKPVIAVGENAYIGLINDSTIDIAKATNFGDCSKKSDFNSLKLINDIQDFITNTASVNTEHYKNYLEEYDSTFVHKQVMSVYKKASADSYLSHFKELPILMYHRVVSEKPLDSNFNIYVTAQELEEQLINLKKRGFTTLTFKDIANSCHVKKPILLTFDDGYEDNHQNLLPLLKKYNMKATVFVLGNRKLLSNQWDAELGESVIPLMSDKQIKACHLSGQIEIASHGLNHHHLPELSKQALKEELLESKFNIESLIADEVVSFAYPYGDYKKREVQAVEQAGYLFGIGTVNGPLKCADDYYRIRRINMFSDTTPLAFWKKTSGYYLRYCKLKGKDF